MNIEDILKFKSLPYKLPDEYPVYMSKELKDKIINNVVEHINKSECEEKEKLVKLKEFYEKNIEILKDMK